MGVSGCGKSTIGRLLSHALSLPFYDGDDYHPAENVAKMSKGIPLNDRDRESWLQALNSLAQKNQKTGAVIACSALKKHYRDTLKDSIVPPPIWIYLQGSYETILDRLKQRRDHFMPSHLLTSQFEALEAPVDAIEVSITLEPEMILKEILKQIK
ncbi:gluconokinase [Muriicola soli]|uniref:Gluconokinase n=2 Tax=Muriicola soli TaxID=2507538 RepID=A0A411EDC9_9FLAO|nr:gluconokinase [Muriicola soli]